MALVVETTSTVTNSTTITKPTSVVAGDLLVLVIGSSGSFTRPGIFPTVTGFTTAVTALGGVANGSLNPNSSSTLLWRIATASDVSASNYTMSQTSSASMFRISGWTSASPIFSSSFFESAGSITTLSLTETLTRPNPQLLIMCGTAEIASSRTTSTYQITSADSNPSWTEVQDVNFTLDSRDKVQAVAYANSSNTSNITNWGLTFSGSTATAASGFLVVIIEPQNASSNVSFLPVVSSIEGLVATNSVTINITHNAVIPTINGVNARANNPVWTDQIKPPATWTPETK